jgi:eukaryotic-like serine/threonine-protein kinase
MWMNMAIQTGYVLNNRYRIARLLGQGGFGAVYRAWDINLNRVCAVKENLETSTQARQQFEREATVLANLSHPNLPRVTDHFVIPNQGQYLVMDFVEGHDLETVVSQQGTLPHKQAFHWISQIADALAYLHTQIPPVIHRDIKPANIRVDAKGKAYLVDFGLVKLFQTQVPTAPAARGVTPGYAPLEQYKQWGTDARTDIYALGATLYTLITGQVPQESVDRAMRDTLPPANGINTKVPQRVGAVVAKAMAMHPDDRYQTAAALKSELRAALTSPALPETVVIPPPPPGIGTGSGETDTISRPVLSGMAIGAAIMAVILVALVAVVGFVVLPKLLETPTPVTSILVVTATSDRVSGSDTATLVGGSSPSKTPTSGIAASTQKQPTNTPRPDPTKTASPVVVAPTGPNSGLIAVNTGRSGHGEIAVMNADGSGFRQLTDHESYCDEPDFSPDGEWIVFERKYGQGYNWEIHIIPTSGGGEQSLGDGRMPAWSLNGQWIAFEVPDDDHHEQIWRMSIDGRNREQLTWDNHANRAPNWSPDGSKLVMMSKIGGNWQIVILDLDTFRQTQITSGSTDKRFPVWSPNGGWIAYNTLRGGNPDQIWIVGVDGGTEKQLTDGGANGRPGWSPDGRYIIYNALVGSEWKVVRIAADGSDYQIVSRGGGDSQPDWTP